MVAALGDSADEPWPETAAVSSPQTAATKDQTVLSLLKVNPPGVALTSQSMAETIESSNIQAAQASATLAHAVNNLQAAAPEASKESASGNDLVARHSEHAKPEAADRLATAKSTLSQKGSQSINDAVTIIVAPFFQIAPPALIAKSSASGPSQMNMHPASGNAAGHPAITFASPSQNISASGATIAAPKTELSMQDAADVPVRNTRSDADENSGSRTAIASLSPETIAEPAAGAATSKPDVSPQDVSGAVPTVPFDNSPVDSGELSSLSTHLSTNSDTEAPRPQIAAARSSTGLQGLRVNHSNDSQLNSTAVQGLHMQPNGAAVGSPVMRETASATVPDLDKEAPVPITAGKSTAETFAAMDGAGNSIHSSWIHAGAHQAEAGFEDPSLGWVSVRAGLNAGGISAVVMPGSAEATAALGAHMAGLHDYLLERHSPVESLTLASAQNTGADAGLKQEMQHQGQQQSAQDNPTNAQASNSTPGLLDTASPAQTTQLNRSDGPAPLSVTGGSYISVMA